MPNCTLGVCNAKLLATQSARHLRDFYCVLTAITVCPDSTALNRHIYNGADEVKRKEEFTASELLSQFLGLIKRRKPHKKNFMWHSTDPVARMKLCETL